MRMGWQNVLVARDFKRPPRFYVERLDQPLAALAAGEAHHALHVLRLTVGAEVELFDGRGTSASGRIDRLNRREVRVLIERVRPAGERARPIVHLACAAPKAGRLDWLLEKLTELEAASFRPIVFERSQAGGGRVKLPASKRERRRAQCISAARQCGLNLLPELREPQTLSAFLSDLPACLRLLGATGESTPPLRNSLPGPEANRDVCILVGPEGGLTDDELADATGAGFLPVRLGHTTLRVETAAVALLSAVRAICER